MNNILQSKKIISQAEILEKKIPFEQPHGRIFDLLKAINEKEEKDVLDVPPSCQSIDAFSLSLEAGCFYLGAMTLKPLKKGGWGGAKTCTSSSADKIGSVGIAVE